MFKWIITLSFIINYISAAAAAAAQTAETAETAIIAGQGKMEKKGICDETLECRRYDFSDDESALCFGYYGCKGAKFETNQNPVCSGTKACLRGQFTGLSAKVLCNGFGGCMRSRGIGGISGLRAAKQINCKGLKACEGIVGGLTAPKIYCDGDLSCTNIASSISSTDLNINSLSGEGYIYCNGHGACKQTQIRSIGSVYCDGDGACQFSRIEAPLIECQGKRVCKNSTLQFADRINAYGWFGAVEAQILEAKTIYAYGFSSLAYANILTRGTNLTLYAYGFSALKSATIDCGGGSYCHIECDSNACKNTPIYVARNSKLTIVPAACDPLHPNYQTSKRDSTLPGKVAGIHCPIIIRAGRPSSSSSSILITDQQLQQQKIQFQIETTQNEEYLQYIQQEQDAQQQFQLVIDEKIQDYQELPNYDDDQSELQYDLQQQQQQENQHDDGYYYNTKRHLMFLQSNNINNNNLSLITSNILTAIAVFMLTGGSIYCVIQQHISKTNKMLPY